MAFFDSRIGEGVGFGNLNEMEHGSLENGEGFNAKPNDISWGSISSLAQH